MRDRIILNHMFLVKPIAVRLHQRLPMHVDLDDLVQAGVLGLVDAATKYDSAKQVAFSIYAQYRIRGAMLDSLRKHDLASRSLRRRHKKVEAATRELSLALSRMPTEFEIAEKVGIDSECLRRMMIELKNVNLLSASTLRNDHDGLSDPDVAADSATHPDNVCAYYEMRTMLGCTMKTLPERYQKIVSMYYTNEMTMKEIGGLLGINESRISQIHKLALRKMHSVLHHSGITSSQYL